MDMYDVQEAIGGLFRRAAGTVCYAGAGAIVAGAAAGAVTALTGGTAIAVATMFGLAAGALCGVSRLFGIGSGRCALGAVIGASVFGAGAAWSGSPLITAVGVTTGLLVGARASAQSLANANYAAYQQMPDRGGYYGNDMRPSFMSTDELMAEHDRNVDRLSAQYGMSLRSRQQRYDR